MTTVDCYPEKAETVNGILDVSSHHRGREIIHCFENITDSATASFDDAVSHSDSRGPESDRQNLSTALHHHVPELKFRTVPSVED